MGRKPSRWKHLPPGMRARPRGRKVYYYFDCGGKPRREIALGADYVIACQKWAELARGDRTATPRLPTWRDAAEAYQRDGMGHLAPKTAREYAAAIRHMLRFFDDPPAPLQAIEPRHWAQYARTRPAISATRERAVFAVIWQHARQVGYTSAECPSDGWKGTVSRRAYSMRDEVYQAIRQAAGDTLRDALDLAYLTGQRPGDVLRMTRSDIHGGYLHVEQGKTRERVRIAVEGELAALLRRIAGRKVDTLSTHLLVTEKGKPLSATTLRSRYDKAREAAAQAHPELATLIRAAQFRDLRPKSATDDEAGAQDRLGHAHPQMTQAYIRRLVGRKARPTK